MTGEGFPDGLRERASRPRLVQLAKGDLEVSATGDIEREPAGDGRNRRCCQVELVEHPDDCVAFGRLVLTEPAGLPLYERERGDGMARIDPTERRAAGVG